MEQEGLIIAGSWCIGEYGDMLVDNDSDKVLGGLLSEEADNEGEENITVDIKPSEDEVILLLNKFIDHFCNNDIICEYILTALAKLSTRLSTSSKEKCRSIISRFVTNTDMEIQQRAVEYNEYMKLDETTLSSLMERIPPLEGASKLLSSRKHNKYMEDSIDLLDDIDNNASQNNLSSASDLLSLNNTSTTNQNQSDNIMDLLGGLSIGQTTISTPISKPTQTNALDDLLGGINSSSSSSQTPSVPVKNNSVDLLGDIFGSTNTNILNSNTSPVNLMNPLTSPTNLLSNNSSTQSKCFLNNYSFKISKILFKFLYSTTYISK